MKNHRYILKVWLEQGKDIVIDDLRVVNQVGRVLRLQPGDTIIVCDGENTEAVCQIKNIDKKSLTVSVENIYTLEHDIREVVLYCSVLKKNNFEWVVQKSTEAGISDIVPIVTSRVVKTGLRYDRLADIALEAAEQSGRGNVPRVHESMQFIEAVYQAKSENSCNILFDPGGHKLLKDNIFSSKTGIFIGPEGGFDEKEVDIARQEGFDIVSLGSLVLRAETAAVVASYIAVN